MNVLILGGGKKSWEIRGRQLGGAIGARVVKKPTDRDFRWADVVVLIKRAPESWAKSARRLRKPIVWDALDFWQQPEENALSEAEARRLLRARIAVLRPTLVIAATQAMAEASGGIYLPHHARPGLHPTPARRIVRTVGYEGIRKYLGRWGDTIHEECARRGWEFVVNPSDLSEMDLVVAFRSGEHDGWMCREWKSGVKVGNAIAAGRPIIGQSCAAMRELIPNGCVTEEYGGLLSSFDYWTDYAKRKAGVAQSIERMSEFSLPTIAARFKTILADVVARRPARSAA